MTKSKSQDAFCLLSSIWQEKNKKLLSEQLLIKLNEKPTFPKQIIITNLNARTKRVHNNTKREKMPAKKPQILLKNVE